MRPTAIPLCRTGSIPDWAVVALVAFLAGCGSQEGPTCRVGADCASGLCRSNGTCAPQEADGIGGDTGPRFDGVGSQDGGTGDSTTSGDSQGGDAGTADGSVTSAADTGKPDGTGTGSCIPNHDGIVSRSEAGVIPGLHAKYAIAKGVSVSFKSSAGPDGKPLWSWQGPYAGDHVSEVTTADPAKAWYAKYFAGATYAVDLSESSGLVGVFELTDKALLLRGAVSPEDGLFATRIVYDPPLPTLQFPLQAGQTWTADATASGLYQGVISLWSEHLEMQVVQQGTAQTPLGNFPVLQVKAKTSKVVGMLTTTYRSQAFVAECFGAVTKVDSGMNEAAEDFTNATEIRRLSP